MPRHPVMLPLVLSLFACDYGRIYYPEVGSGGVEWAGPGQTSRDTAVDADTDTDTDADTDTDTDTDTTDAYGLFEANAEGVWPCGLGPRDDIGVVTVYNRLGWDMQLFEVADDCSESSIGTVSAEASYPFSLWAETVYLLRDTSGAPKFWFRLPDLEGDVVLEYSR